MYNLCDLKGKCYIVTGSSSGIGRETAITISRMGGKVVLAGRNEDALAKTLKLMERPEDHIIEVFDLTQIDKIGIWVRDIVGRHSLTFDGMVYAAGIYKLKPLAVTEYSDLTEIMVVNFYAAISMLKHLAKTTICKKGSSFVFISSVSGETGEIGSLGYGASKAALNSAVRSASLELARIGYRVNAIAPAAIDTRMFVEYVSNLDENQASKFRDRFPLGIGNASDVANMAAFLLSDSSRWITGSVIKVDGGYSVGK